MSNNKNNRDPSDEFNIKYPAICQSLNEPGFRGSFRENFLRWSIQVFGIFHCQAPVQIPSSPGFSIIILTIFICSWRTEWVWRPVFWTTQSQTWSGRDRLWWRHSVMTHWRQTGRESSQEPRSSSGMTFTNMHQTTWSSSISSSAHPLLLSTRDMWRRQGSASLQTLEVK